MKIALLTCRSWPGVYEKELALAAEMPHGITARVEAWDDPTVDWAAYDCLVFRSVWDYFERPAEFDTWLAELARQHIRTLNPLEVIRRNQHKFYLQELEARGVEIIPTVFLPKGQALDLSFVSEAGWQAAVIKPAVSGGSYLTRLFEQHEAAAVAAEYQAVAMERDLLVQPFMPEVQETGELSLLFFGGEYAYSVSKLPQAGDFRVQSQFGGQYRACEPDAATLRTAAGVVESFGGNLLYARVDGLLREGQFLLMELELIEPDLYFDCVPDGKRLYLAALERMLREG